MALSGTVYAPILYIQATEKILNCHAEGQTNRIPKSPSGISLEPGVIAIFQM
jgi:hypothetical protein